MDSKDLGARIKERRKKQRLSAVGLADKLNISSGLLSGYEKGNKTPSLERLIKISNTLKTTPDDLLQDYLEVDSNDALYKKFLVTIGSLPNCKIEAAIELICALTEDH